MWKKGKVPWEPLQWPCYSSKCETTTTQPGCFALFTLWDNTMKKKKAHSPDFIRRKPPSKPTLQSSSHPLIWPYRIDKSRLRVVTWNPDNQSTIFFYFFFFSSFVRTHSVYGFVLFLFLYSLQYFMAISRCNRTNGKLELNHLSIFNA